MPRDDISILLSFLDVHRINVDSETVCLFSFPDRSEDFLIVHRKQQLLRMLEHEHLLFVIFSRQDNICLDVMRKHIAAEENDLLERQKLITKQLFKKSVKVMILLHEILHTRKDTSEPSDGRQVAKDILLVGMLMDISKDFLDHARIKHHRRRLTSRDAN